MGEGGSSRRAQRNRTVVPGWARSAGVTVSESVPEVLSSKAAPGSPETTLSSVSPGRKEWSSA